MTEQGAPAASAGVSNARAGLFYLEGWLTVFTEKSEKNRGKDIYRVNFHRGRGKKMYNVTPAGKS
jgi:hypothetical protein